MYFLMNKNEKVGSFIKPDDGFGDRYQMINSEANKLPIGFTGINAWLENRKGSKHNAHLKKIMQLCGCDQTDGFMKLTHATSLNDTFWVKSESESIEWNDVSLYKREFNEVISRLAFEGVGLYGIEFSSTSPEMSTEGSFRKCWIREQDEIFLYKRGSSIISNCGLEPYGEVMTSEFAKELCKNSVEYDLCKLHGEIASKCKLFTSEDIGYAPFVLIARQHNIENTVYDLLKYFESIGSEEDFRRMLILDSITFNIDRHMGNYGVMFDNNSLRIIGMSKIFDFNLAMLPYVAKEDFESIGNKISEFGPKIGTDFTRTAQTLLNSSIRSDLINLKGFKFSFRGDANYPEWRVKKMEELMNKQIDAILSKSQLYTKDVFVPKEKEEQKSLNNKNDFIRLQEEKADSLIEKFISKGLMKKEQICLNYYDDHLELYLYLDDKYTYIINMENDELSVEENDNPMSYYDVMTFGGKITDTYMELSKVIDGVDDNKKIEDQPNIGDEN